MRKFFALFCTFLMLFILVACGGKEQVIDVEEITSIKITTAPTTTVYVSGNNFDPSGMVVTAVYNTGKTETISEYSIVDGNNLKLGTKEVKIAYQEHTVSQSVEVKPAELPVLVSVKRTGNLITGIGKMAVLIDDEEVFQVKIDQTESVTITMLEGIHTIQTKGQGDKSKKVEFEVVNGEVNEFYFTSEISNFYGIELEERNYLPE